MGKKKPASGPAPATGSKQPAKAPKSGSASTPAQPDAAVAPITPFRRPVSFNFAGVGRNDICPCGSGKRFKNCHGH